MICIEYANCGDGDENDNDGDGDDYIWEGLIIVREVFQKKKKNKKNITRIVNAVPCHFLLIKSKALFTS